MDLAMHARVSLLNGFALVLGDDECPVAVASLCMSVQRLIACLSLSGRPGRAAIAGQLWPDITEGQAQCRLRSALWRLHKAVPGLVDVSGGALRLADNVRVDVREFEDWGQRVLDPHTDIDAVVMPAVAIHGELLPGWYDDWVLLERDRLRQLRMHALERLAERLTEARRYGEAVQAAHAAILAGPLRESSQRVLIRVHLAEGNVVEAIRVYESFRRMLATELGIAPTALMEDLVLRIGAAAATS